MIEDSRVQKNEKNPPGPYYGLMSISPRLIRVDPPIAGIDLESIVTVAILPQDDITISSEIGITFIVPETSKTEGLRIKTNNIRVFPSDLVVSYNEINISYIDRSKKYSLAVWFFAIRSYLRKPSDIPWMTPVVIQNQLSSTSSLDDLVSIVAGAGRTRGKRAYMEDVDIAFDMVRVTNRMSISIFGVLDGHGGQECARFAADEIPTKIMSGLRAGRSFADILYESYIETDADFLRGQSGGAGSTANILLFDPVQSVIYVANVGDTRSVLCRGDRAIDLTEDMKATNPAEIARIAAAGGHVMNGRVLGSLAVARALGDLYLKEGSGVNRKRSVIPDPEITSFRTQADDEFIIVASDGLWDVMASQPAVDMVREQLSKAIPGGTSASGAMSKEIVQDHLSRIADMMANHASKNLGSSDNVTVQLLLLRRTPEDVTRRKSASTTELFLNPFDGRAYSSSNLRSGGSSSGKRPSSNQLNGAESSYVRRGSGSISVEAQPAVDYRTTPTSTSAAQTQTQGAGTGASKPADDDDLMSFLLDDANF